MQRSWLFGFCLITGLLFSIQSGAQNIDYRGFPEWSWHSKDSTEYYLYTPSGAKGKQLPLILFLHGCCGEDYHATLRNAVDPPVRVWHNFGENSQSVPAYILSPKTSRGWKQHFNNLKSVMDDLVSRNLVDPQRIYISGFSMGSAGTWEFIEAYPNYFAAAIAMGMDFKGKDAETYPDVPVWAIRGDQDWWARHLGSQIQALRGKTMKNADSLEWHTGINPRLTNFEGMGHVVMWPAVNELPLSEWLFSKVNDGNKYPVVVCRAPSYKQPFKNGEIITVDFEAFHPDGRIVSYEFTVNGKIVSKTGVRPSKLTFKAEPGDNMFSITVIDSKGKSATETGMIRVDVPVVIQDGSLAARAGKYVRHRLSAAGNGDIRWALAKNTSLPEGLALSNEGIISGIPVTEGTYSFSVTATDEDADLADKNLHVIVEAKDPSQVLVRSVLTHSGKTLFLVEAKKGVTPHARSDNEVTLSYLPPEYAGLSLIQTEPNDTTTSGTHYLQFEVDSPVTVYVAYETLGKAFKSTTPPWLEAFRKENGEIVAQYFYYHIYARDFPAGTIKLPHSLEKSNGVNTNYFVMIKKKKS